VQLHSISFTNFQLMAADMHAMTKVKVFEICQADGQEVMHL